jgi:phosphoserine phosphatase
MKHYKATLFTENEAEIAVFKDGIATVSEGWLQDAQVYQMVVSSTGHELRITNIDFIIEPHPTPAKKLLISDMDSTMIQQECIDELADFVGKKAHVAAITERAMNGELVFEDALRERVALLAGLPVETLQQCFDERITAMGGAKELVAAFKKQGGKCVLVSGGFTFFTERVAAMLGFDEHYANVLEIENGKLTGKVREPILGKEAKLAELHRQCKLLGCAPENVIAIGDGANDLPMLQAAGLGIAYHAKPTVAAQVASRITHGDLSSIIHVL